MDVSVSDYLNSHSLLSGSGSVDTAAVSSLLETLRGEISALETAREEIVGGIVPAHRKALQNIEVRYSYKRYRSGTSAAYRIVLSLLSRTR